MNGTQEKAPTGGASCPSEQEEVGQDAQSTVARDVADRIQVGIAGWSYEDWKGTVYPPGTRDTLRYIAPFVDVIEINSPFYRTPSARTVDSWVKRTEDLSNFQFTAKLHQDITHRGRLDSHEAAAFRAAFDSMQQAGKLSHLLAQFRFDFEDSADSRRHLEAINEAFGDMANLTFEFRHRSWQTEEALQFVSGLGSTIANLDYPAMRTGFDLEHCTVGQHAYMRLHGRNSKAWFDRKAGRDETYDYLYNDREIDAITHRALDIASLSKTMTLIANNHYRGKEVANALQIKALLTAEKVDVPPLLAKTYPELNDIRRQVEAERDLLGFNWTETEER
jgi:uncharacterized protein YecE (DUF72 family)